MCLGTGTLLTIFVPNHAFPKPAAIFGVQIEGPARRKLDNGYYDVPIPAASIDLNFICVDDGDIECALGRGRCRRGLSNVIKGSITASGLGALFARE